MKTHTILAAVLLCCCGSFLRADSPAPKPWHYEIESRSKKYIAAVDPAAGVTVQVAGSRQTLWSLPKIWSPSAFLADDGEHLVTGYYDLIPVEYRTNLVLITFWRRDQKIGEVTVGQLFADGKALKRTLSHCRWGRIIGIEGSKLTVRRCDEREIRFDIVSGKETK